MTSEEEADAVKAIAIGLLREARPEVIGTPWYQRLFVEQFRPRRLGERLRDRVRRDARRWFER